MSDTAQKFREFLFKHNDVYIVQLFFLNNSVDRKNVSLCSLKIKDVF